MARHAYMPIIPTLMRSEVLKSEATLGCIETLLQKKQQKQKTASYIHSSGALTSLYFIFVYTWNEVEARKTELTKG